MIPSLEGWPAKAKEVPSPHEARLTPLDTNQVFQCLGERLARKRGGDAFEGVDTPKHTMNTKQYLEKLKNMN